ncbi:MAG TPA: two-component regulator propeller domain-containing protein, partial [Desulfuromonadaceae bacterium]|nr:two-component regulator propeller domain-containing protein [Desulfuromonadaceae bacterium]
MIPEVRQLSYGFVAMVFLLSCVLAPGLPADSAWLVRTWKSDEGLPNNHVTGLAQTPDGYLWVATFSRPARFDGVQFEKFFLHDFDLPANQKITALQRARAGLWLGTSHGYVVFLNADTVRIFTNGLPDKVIQAMVEDGEGGLWTTYQNGVVCRLKDGQVTSFTSQDGLPPSTLRDQSACSLACDARGRVWFAKNGHFGLFHNSRFETMFPLSGMTARLAASRNGGVWVGSDGELIRVADGKSPEKVGSFGGAGVAASVLFEDRNGGVWIGTENNGLYHYDGRQVEEIPVSDRGITSIVDDHEGNIWVGTESGGLDRLRPRAIDLETVDAGLPEGTVQSLCEGKDRTIWAATQNGLLLRKENGVWKTVSTNADWPGGRATCVVADDAGSVWIGTRDRALYCWRDGHFTALSRTGGMIGREIHALLAARNGDIWIGEESPDVVARLHEGRWEVFPMPPGVRIIRAMTEDPSGRIWTGSSGGRLVCIANGIVTDETPRTTGTPLSIRCVRATADGGIWIGYADEGVGWFKDGRFVHLT